MYPEIDAVKLSKNEMPGSVRQWRPVALVTKAPSHSDCVKTADGLPRSGYNVTSPALAVVTAILCVY
jgi:hypothetical protein